MNKEIEEPNYDKILKSKIEYYGETKAAYEFAAEELARQEVSKALEAQRGLTSEQSKFISKLIGQKKGQAEKRLRIANRGTVMGEAIAMYSESILGNCNSVLEALKEQK